MPSLLNSMTNLPRKKLIIVGDGCTGKSALLMTYATKNFPTSYVPTVFENYAVTPTLSSGRRIELTLWDTAGQEDYDRLRPLSYPDTDIVLITFNTGHHPKLDPTVSFSNVKSKWYPEVVHFVPHAPIVLVGTMTDLRDKAIVEGRNFISTEDGWRMAKEIKAHSYKEVCSRTWTPDVMDGFFTGLADLAMRGDSKKRRGDGCLVM